MAVELSKQSSQESRQDLVAVQPVDTQVVAVQETHQEVQEFTHQPSYTQTYTHHGNVVSQPSYYPSYHHGRVISTHQGEHRDTGETHIIATRTGDRRFTGETRVVETQQVGMQQVATRVVGIEKGIERQISVTEVAVGEEIIGEHTTFAGKGRRGRKIVREEVIEKVIVVPETVQIEEWVEDEYDMHETVIEVAKKFQIEKIVEVPEIEIVEKTIEQIEKIVREKIVEVPRIQTVERIVHVPVIQTVEKIIEVPEIQYRDVPVERIVEVPEYKTQEVVREVKRINLVDKPIEQKKLVIDHTHSTRRLPVPVEAETIVEFTVPHLRANYIKKKFPVYLPRFIEVPVSRQFIDAETVNANAKYAGRLANLISVKPAVSLCEIEGLASEMKVFYDKNNINSKKMHFGQSVSESAKRELFSRTDLPLQSFAPYKHLPVDVSGLSVGHHRAAIHDGSHITYSSATFGSHPRTQYTTTHPTITHTTHTTPSLAYKVGHAIGSAISH